MFRYRPIRRYRAPTYPRPGYVVPKTVHRSFWSAKVVGHAGGMLPLAACELLGMRTEIGGDIAPPHPTLSEAEARKIIFEEINQTLERLRSDVQAFITFLQDQGIL